MRLMEAISGQMVTQNKVKALQNMEMAGQGSPKFIGNVTICQSTYEFLLAFHSNYIPILDCFCLHTGEEESGQKNIRQDKWGRQLGLRSQSFVEIDSHDISGDDSRDFLCLDTCSNIHPLPTSLSSHACVCIIVIGLSETSSHSETLCCVLLMLPVLQQ